MSIDDQIIELVFGTNLFIQALWFSISNKVLKTGYVQLDNYYSHYSITERRKVLKTIDNLELRSLMEKSQPIEDGFLNTLKEINRIAFDMNVLPENTKVGVGTVIISWLLYCAKQKYAGIIRKNISEKVAKEYNVIYVDDKYIIRRDIDYKIVTNLNMFIEIILGLNPKNTIFFRGQESINYWLQPSIRRSSDIYKNEARLYQELILRCPDDFSKCKSHLDHLVQMQHYGLPTRLIDITSNPLVALYFSTLGKSDTGSGEVIVFNIKDMDYKYERSDTVTILSCLPLFSYEDQCKLLELSNNLDGSQFNQDETVLRLLHEIKIDKPAFANRIVPEDLRKNLVVTPSLRNNRIIKQSGAFIICGLVDCCGIHDQPLESLRHYNLSGNKTLLIIENKEKTQKELGAFNINGATLFPEIDDVASYLKNNWL